MKILFVCVLKLIFISAVFTQSDTPCHVCEYTGVSFQPTVDIPFSVSDIPKRCKLVTYASYYFDGTDMDDVHMYKNDEGKFNYFWKSDDIKKMFKAAIKSLVAAGIPVYTYATFNETEKWNEIIDAKDQTKYDQYMRPLIEKLNELQVNGIIFYIVNLYDGTPDYANKIKSFITKLKEQLPKLKFCLNINGHDNFGNISNKELFDYSVTNSVIDLYFVDMHTHNYECTPELFCDGTPITSSDTKVLTLEVINNAISQSAIDKAKAIACIYIFPLTPHTFEIYTPYSQYCDDLSAARAEKWCLDKSQKLYDIGAFLKKSSFAGVAGDWLEYDDVQCLCQCQKFPVTNLIFDGWDGVPIKPCPKIG